ncbi:MAG: NAD(P)H-dependent oxidoreductase [Vicinamibacterales bacterium]
MNPPLLQIVTVSTREHRKGPAITAWFEQAARAHGGFAIEVVDLAEVNLPMMNEPENPRLRHYRHEHTKAWSLIATRADAFVFVLPEYNHSIPPSLANALDYLLLEWAYKAAAFVSYGGVSGGLRAVQHTKPMLTGLRMMPIPEAVVIPFFNKQINEAGIFTPNPAESSAAASMLDELLRWTMALQALRA